ncbi:hypothetical protein [Bifidobacterium ruminantium]|uniref:hypothetical protein n=1 Tax=Bifidobacterium ruminantium TaxID=78346 RepID=UPI001C23B2B0|nr:hypothetical protein [Bifidobacterium ruminantium]MBU9111142.1 hypothetical protein [Bifidobacterium ruminantium]
MGYTPERFMADSGITSDEVEAEKRRMLEEIRLHELKRHASGAIPVGRHGTEDRESPMPSRTHGPQPCR